MSGHNKWSSIKHKKGAADAKRGKMFSRLAREITMSARDKGGDPDLNPRLRAALTSAKAANMPSDNVERAIKKGTGELAGGRIEELSYEGFAPGGVGILVTCLSDNRNRTAADIRAVFTRHNSSLAGGGAVARMFHRKTRLLVKCPDNSDEKLLEALLDKGVDVDDVNVADGQAEVIAPADAFADAVGALEAAGMAIVETTLTMIPETQVRLDDAHVARQVLRLVETLEEQDDVQAVYSNFDIPDALLEKLAAEA